MSNITQNSPINPARGGRSDHMKKLEALFGGGNQAAEKTAKIGFQPATSKSSVEARFAKAFNKPETSAAVADDINAVLAAKTPSVYKIRLERIKNATNENELNNAIDVFLNNHEVPNDIGVILKILHHPNEAMVRKGLAELVGMLERKETGGGSLIKDALNTLESRQPAPGPETMSYINGIKSMLNK